MKPYYNYFERNKKMMQVEPHKKKAMSSEKASFVKKEGHLNEDDFAVLIDGDKINSTGKTDIKKGDWNFSLKKECKRIQLALYSRNSKNWIENSISSQLCKECISIYPNSFEEYSNQKLVFKEKLREKMINLKNYLVEKPNLSDFLHLFITNNREIHFIVMKDKGKQYIYYADQVIETLTNYTIAYNSTAVKKGDVSDQKVILKYTNEKNKPKNIIEIEIRNSSPNHYAQFLCICNRNDLFYLLNKHITEEKIFQNMIHVKGQKCIDLFESHIFNSTEGK